MINNILFILQKDRISGHNVISAIRDFCEQYDTTSEQVAYEERILHGDYTLMIVGGSHVQVEMLVEYVDEVDQKHEWGLLKTPAGEANSFMADIFRGDKSRPYTSQSNGKISIFLTVEDGVIVEWEEAI
jgi:hypothetical protein